MNGISAVMCSFLYVKNSVLMSMHKDIMAAFVMLDINVYVFYILDDALWIKLILYSTKNCVCNGLLLRKVTS